jgi:hypothetical protein
MSGLGLLSQITLELKFSQLFLTHLSDFHTIFRCCYNFGKFLYLKAVTELLHQDARTLVPQTL